MPNIPRLEYGNGFHIYPLVPPFNVVMLGKDEAFARPTGLPVRQGTRFGAVRLLAAISKLPVRQGTSVITQSPIFTFLSCLCGRELMGRTPGTDTSFLSCLCGREPVIAHCATHASFLSCLCGREPQNNLLTLGFAFLSCLCGRELVQI